MPGRLLLPLLLLAQPFIVSCGSSSGNSRHLQSITISQTVNGQQVEFVATGTFSAPPTTVTPLPVDWTMGYLSPPAPTITYSLRSQPFSFDCKSAGVPAQLTAFAPSNPNAPSSGTLPWASLTMGHAAVKCP
jgi:hypothetical protein